MTYDQYVNPLTEDTYGAYRGMMLRDYFAAQLIPHLLKEYREDLAIAQAYAIADKMMEARKPRDRK